MHAQETKPTKTQVARLCLVQGDIVDTSVRRVVLGPPVESIEKVGPDNIILDLVARPHGREQQCGEQNGEFGRRYHLLC
jgi:hypothetical protein